MASSSPLSTNQEGRQLADALILVSGHNGSGKTKFIRTIVEKLMIKEAKDPHANLNSTCLSIIINDSPITNIDPQLSHLRKDIEKAGSSIKCNQPILVKGGGCVCCEGGGDLLHEAMETALQALMMMADHQPNEDDSSKRLKTTESSFVLNQSPRRQEKKIIIVELNANSSLNKLPGWLLSSYASKTIMVSMINLDYFTTQLSSRLKPFGAMDSTSSLTFQQVKRYDGFLFLLIIAVLWVIFLFICFLYLWDVKSLVVSIDCFSNITIFNIIHII